MDDKELFLIGVEKTLNIHPEWLELTIKAIMKGQEGAYKSLESKYIELDQALMAALSLLGMDRKSKKMIQYLNNLILEKIRLQKSKAPIEEKFLEKYGN